MCVCVRHRHMHIYILTIYYILLKYNRSTQTWPTSHLRKLTLSRQIPAIKIQARLGSLSRLPSTNTGSGGGLLRIIVILQMRGHDGIVAGKADFTLCDLREKCDVTPHYLDFSPWFLGWKVSSTSVSATCVENPPRAVCQNFHHRFSSWVFSSLNLSFGQHFSPINLGTLVSNVTLFLVGDVMILPSSSMTFPAIFTSKWPQLWPIAVLVLVAIDLGPSTLEPSAPTFPGNQLLVLIGRGESVGSDHFFQQMWGTAIHFNIYIYIDIYYHYH